MNTEQKILNLCKEGAIQLFKWENPKIEQPKGVLLIVHGMAEHIERYTDFVKLINNAGFIVYGHNQRGHKGSISSKANYGYIGDDNVLDILVSDVNEIVDLIKINHPNLPIFILGHSMGSAVSQRFCQLHGKKINGVILSGAMKNSALLLKMGIFFSSLITCFFGKKHRSKFIDKLTFQTYNRGFKPNRTAFDWLNRDEKEVDKYVNDEYCGGLFTVSFFRGFFKGLETIARNYELVSKDLPMLIISGSKDPVGGYSKDITNLYNHYQKLQIKDLEFKLYPEARHEILLELCKDEVRNDCINWLLTHI
jgi:alpha-beta hydrolase superfamily lysophospholipase